jgi:hypothetical protein
MFCLSTGQVCFIKIGTNDGLGSSSKSKTQKHKASEGTAGGDEQRRGNQKGVDEKSYLMPRSHTRSSSDMEEPHEELDADLEYQIDPSFPGCHLVVHKLLTRYRSNHRKRCYLKNRALKKNLLKSVSQESNCVCSFRANKCMIAARDQ